LADLDAIEQQQFQIDESWSERSESKKQNYFNEALKERELDLINAREELQMLRSKDGSSSAVVGSLFALAYQLNEAAAHKARMNDDEIPESIEKLREEFNDALRIEYEYREDQVLTPHKVQELSEKVGELGRPPAKLQDLMDQNGTKIRNLIGLAYAGTEVMTEGSSEEESMIEQDEG
jgi:hypothetical protein